MLASVTLCTDQPQATQCRKFLDRFTRFLPGTLHGEMAPLEGFQTSIDNMTLRFGSMAIVFVTSGQGRLRRLLRDVATHKRAHTHLHAYTPMHTYTNMRSTNASCNHLRMKCIEWRLSLWRTSYVLTLGRETSWTMNVSTALTLHSIRSHLSRTRSRSTWSSNYEIPLTACSSSPNCTLSRNSPGTRKLNCTATERRRM